MDFFEDGAERQAKDGDNQSASEKARQRTLEQLCLKWLDDLAKAIGELDQTLKQFDPVRDNQGGFWSHRKQGYTVPGGHREKIQNLSNRIENLIKKNLIDVNILMINGDSALKRRRGRLTMSWIEQPKPSNNIVRFRLHNLYRSLLLRSILVVISRLP